MTRGRLLAGGALAAAAAALVVAARGHPPRHDAPAPAGAAADAALPVGLAEVRTHPMADRIATFGNLLPYRTAAIAPQVTGQIARLLFEDGATVEAGQPLVEFDRRAAEAQVAAARSRLEADRQNLRRTEVLARQGLSAQQGLEQAQSQAAASLSALRAAEMQADLLVLRAPFRGTLGTREVDAGAVVSPGQRIAAIEDRSRLIVEFRVRGDAYPRLRPGQRFTLDLPRGGGGGEEPVSGEVVFVAAALEPGTRTALLRGILDNAALGLPAGLYLGVTLELALRPDALAVPAAAVLRDLSGAHVFVVGEDGRARRRDVALGGRDGDAFEVRSGLRAAERVVAEGAFRLRDGDPVRAAGGPVAAPRAATAASAAAASAAGAAR